jgi:3-deoxy-manno-octulosonate cytidylyltransferase (CMP-KDO synthetase)
MIEHVRRRVVACTTLDRVVVATCDEEIFQVVRSNGGEAVMTASSHDRCTTRVEEAVRALDPEPEIVVIVQGDEPLLLPHVVERLVAGLLASPGVGCTNLVSPIDSLGEVESPDVVKAVLDSENRILYLSRSPIPFTVSDEPTPRFRQMGVMAFRSQELYLYGSLPESPLERAESVDMLRLIENGRSIQGVITSASTIGVDHPTDVERIESVLRSDPLQAQIFAALVGSSA